MFFQTCILRGMNCEEAIVKLTDGFKVYLCIGNVVLLFSKLFSSPDVKKELQVTGDS